jgi:hypothetical protein
MSHFYCAGHVSYAVRYLATPERPYVEVRWLPPGHPERRYGCDYPNQGRGKPCPRRARYRAHVN